MKLGTSCGGATGFAGATTTYAGAAAATCGCCSYLTPVKLVDSILVTSFKTSFILVILVMYRDLIF